MNQLLPIIRRARRPLYPPNDAAPAVPVHVAELPVHVPPVEDVASAPAEVPPAAPVTPKAKKAKRGANALA
jgi:hypothetical protein